MTEPVFTLANQLTLLRMALAPLLVVLVVSGRLGWALVVFVVAGVTDLLDGLIARLHRQQTALGAMLDPVADKILLSSSFIALTWSGHLAVRIPAWLTVVVLSRDAIIIMSVAILNLTLGRRVYYPTLLGKLSTASQILCVGLTLLANVTAGVGGALALVHPLTLLLTVTSALHYVYLASTGKSGEEARR